MVEKAEAQISTDEQDIRALLAVGFGIGYFGILASLLYMFWHGKIDVEALMTIFGSVSSSAMIGVSWYFASKTSKSG